MERQFSKAQVITIMVNLLQSDGFAEEIDVNSPSAGEAKFNALGLDSLSLLQFSMDMEDMLGVELEVGEFPREATLNEFAEYLVGLRA